MGGYGVSLTTACHEFQQWSRVLIVMPPALKLCRQHSPLLRACNGSSSAASANPIASLSASPVEICQIMQDGSASTVEAPAGATMREAPEFSEARQTPCQSDSGHDVQGYLRRSRSNWQPVS